MKREHIKKLFEKLKISRVRDSSDGVMGSCPFAEWEHTDKMDRHPSFGVQENIAGESKWNCFACGNRGLSLMSLLIKLNKYKKLDKDIYDFVSLYDSSDVGGITDYIKILDRAGAKNQTNYINHINVNVGIPISALNQFSVIQKDTDLYDYLCKRGVDIDMYKFMWDGENGNIVIPIFDADNKLVGCQGRRYPKKGYIFYLYDSYKERFVLKYNESELNRMIRFEKSKYIYPEYIRRDGDIIIVEGIFDAIYLRRFGYNAVSIFGTNISNEQVIKIMRLAGKSVHILMDGDKAGELAGDKIRNMLMKFRYTKVKVNLHKIDRDPDELSGDELRQIINNNNEVERSN